MAATYDRLAKKYDRFLRPLDRWYLSRLRERALASLPHGGQILELGAGTGRNFIFYPETARGLATDPSREMLRIAATKQMPHNVFLVQTCAEELPFESNSFDAAFATLVFCSVASPAKSFAELTRVVRKGGHVILLEHVRPGGLLGIVFDLLNFITVPLFDDHFNRRTPEEAAAAGLEVEAVEKFAAGILALIKCRV